MPMILSLITADLFLLATHGGQRYNSLGPRVTMTVSNRPLGPGLEDQLDHLDGRTWAH